MINKTLITIVLGLALIVLLASSVYTIDEGTQVIITEFGKPVGKPVTTAGVHFKIPFTQDVRRVEKRILYWDGFPNQIPTKDKTYIKVDTTARWKIVDALKFIQTVQNEMGAKARLDAILDATTRDVISNHNLVEAVRNSNTIIDKVKEMRTLITDRQKNGEEIVEDELGSEIEQIKVGREELSRMIVENADKELEQLGIKLVDVQLRRISYEKTVEDKVYERMISERQRIAQKIRSIGEGEKAKIEGRIDKDLKEIESKAYMQAQTIKGKAEAEAIAIYAKAYSKDPEFYQFLRSMDAYKSSFSEKAKFMLSTKSEFLRYLNENK